ncbi:MAG: serine hydrolase domain-containing protein, partial [Woeseiales bacterium]
ADDQPGDYSISLQRIEAVALVPERRLDQLLSAFEGDDQPGAVVAVIRNGRVIHSHAVGMANLQHRIPFTRRTVSNIGSVSKQFTGFAVAMLAAEGKLSFDEDVRQYFPELPDLGRVVTIRHLLTHTSGYREFLNLLAMSGTRLEDGDYIDRDVILKILQRQESLQSEPG